MCKVQACAESYNNAVIQNTTTINIAVKHRRIQCAQTCFLCSPGQDIILIYTAWIQLDNQSMYLHPKLVTFPQQTSKQPYLLDYSLNKEREPRPGYYIGYLKLCLLV